MLKRVQDPAGRIRKGFFKFRKKARHRFPFRFPVGGAAGTHHRQRKGFLHMPDVALGKIHERADHRNPRPAHPGDRVKGMEPSFMEEGKEQRFNGVFQDGHVESRAYSDLKKDWQRNPSN